MTLNPERIALITGANKGIGLEVARQLALSGHTILVGARDNASGHEAALKLQGAGLYALHLPIDVTDAVSIQKAASMIRTRYGKLDVLINNAGISIDAAALPSQLSIEVLRKTFDTNVFGAFAVLQAMLPLLRNAEAGRVVNVSSGLGSLTNNSDANYEYARVKFLAYNSSKTTLNAFTVQFAHELQDTPIKVNAADPGFTATDLNNHRGTRSVEQAARVIVRLATLPSSGPTGGFFDENGPVPW